MSFLCSPRDAGSGTGSPESTWVGCGEGKSLANPVEVNNIYIPNHPGKYPAPIYMNKSNKVLAKTIWDRVMSANDFLTSKGQKHEGKAEVAFQVPAAGGGTSAVLHRRRKLRFKGKPNRKLQQL